MESLETLVRLYITPLQESLARDNPPILSQTDLSTLFSNINVLAGLNRNFLRDLSERLKSWDNATTQIGDIFLGFAPFFKMYTSYCGNHDTATEALKRIEKDNRKFRELIEANLGRPENKGLSLASYLIMPIQRIPRYKLLLDELLRNTGESHPDYAGLVKSQELVSSVAKHVNDAMHATENRNTILRIQSEFTHPVTFVQPSRRFIKEGPMVKKCRNSDKLYQFFLFNDMLAVS